MVFLLSKLCAKLRYDILTSGTKWRSHGLYDIPIALLAVSKKASFDGFQKLALTSGVKATPASPIAPERESGDIFKKGTAVGIAFEVLLPFVVVCAIANKGDNSNIYI
jgi:hypothetical protein